MIVGKTVAVGIEWKHVFFFFAMKGIAFLTPRTRTFRANKTKKLNISLALQSQAEDIISLRQRAMKYKFKLLFPY